MDIAFEMARWREVWPSHIGVSSGVSDQRQTESPHRQQRRTGRATLARPAAAVEGAHEPQEKYKGIMLVSGRELKPARCLFLICPGTLM